MDNNNLQLDEETHLRYLWNHSVLELYAFRAMMDSPLQFHSQFSALVPKMLESSRLSSKTSTSLLSWLQPSALLQQTCEEIEEFCSSCHYDEEAAPSIMPKRKSNVLMQVLIPMIRDRISVSFTYSKASSHTW